MLACFFVSSKRGGGGEGGVPRFTEPSLHTGDAQCYLTERTMFETQHDIGLARTGGVGQRGQRNLKSSLKTLSQYEVGHLADM